MVSAAVLAANAHNAQPWHFRVATNRIDLFADTSRRIGTMDPLGREMHISLGCALENLALGGSANGMAPTVALLPDLADRTHIARVDLARAQRSASVLFGAIPNRHTNRAAFDIARGLTQRQLDAFSGLFDVPEIELVWFTRAADKLAFDDLMTRATEAIIADSRQRADDFAWYRTDWREIQARKDGITIDPSGKSLLIRDLAKVLPVSRKQNNDGWLSGTRRPRPLRRLASELSWSKTLSIKSSAWALGASGSGCTCRRQPTGWACSPCVRSWSASTESSRPVCPRTSALTWPRCCLRVGMRS
jgi:hypothetical protein